MGEEENENKPRVLVVEDDKENRKYLELILRKTYDVDLCESSDKFLDILSQKPYDIIIMDITLDGNKNGLTLTKELRNSSKYKHIPVLGLSAHVFSKDRAKAREAGMDVYLTKPIDYNKLINTLEKLIG